MLNDIEIIMIVAVDRAWGIGRDGGLLVHLPGDLKYFKEKTLGQIVVMGRKTLESLPGGGPLPERTNVVLTRNPLFAVPGLIVCHSFVEVEKSLPDLVSRRDGNFENGETPLRVCIIGGATIYRTFLPYADTCFVTKIDAVLDADVFFPNLDKDAGFRLVTASDPVSENGFDYRFTTYSAVV
jgi:dihydrofolate reductase